MVDFSSNTNFKTSAYLSIKDIRLPHHLILGTSFDIGFID